MLTSEGLSRSNWEEFEAEGHGKGRLLGSTTSVSLGEAGTDRTWFCPCPSLPYYAQCAELDHLPPLFLFNDDERGWGRHPPPFRRLVTIVWLLVFAVTAFWRGLFSFLDRFLRLFVQLTLGLSFVSFVCSCTSFGCSCISLGRPLRWSPGFWRLNISFEGRVLSAINLTLYVRSQQGYNSGVYRI